MGEERKHTLDTCVGKAPETRNLKANEQMRSKKKHALQFGRVAMRYFPECNYKNALRHFRDEIVKTRGLLEALTEIGYTPSQRTLTLRQMKVIEDFLGEPD